MIIKKIARKLGNWAPWLLVRLYKLFIGSLMATCKVRVKGLDTFIQTASNGKCALILWHDKLGIAAALLKKYAPQLQYLAVVSNSRDGRILGQLATSYQQCGALFVPHNARDIALRQMTTALKDGRLILIVTPDGPRGPKYRLKPGIAVAAINTGAAVVPLSWSSSRSWQLPTWDKMSFPKPFSTIDVNFGAPLTFPQSIDVDEAVNSLENSLTTQ